MLSYILGYCAFVLGSLIYLIGKAKEYKKMAKLNPDPKVIYSTRRFISEEWLNFAQFYLGGIALVIFTPMLIGGAVVEVKSSTGVAIGSFALKSVLTPMYFLIGMAGNSALFAYFGKYKKTILGTVGVDDGQP